MHNVSIKRMVTVIAITTIAVSAPAMQSAFATPVPPDAGFDDAGFAIGAGWAVLGTAAVDRLELVREACRRLVGSTVQVTGRDLTWDMVPYDVQLIGGVMLHEGRIAEMATGEGKTLVATMPLYLNALSGKGVHAALRMAKS